jgi:pSer/pThr/pTyr-binding forkhead associated (FHA) protein
MPTIRLRPTSGEPIVLHKETSVVGRDPASDVVVADGSVSRKHARLDRRGELWFVVDNGSANGTFLDSQRVSEAPLRNGQELRFGAVPFVVEIEEAAPHDLSATVGQDDGATVVQPVPSALRPPLEATVPPPAPKPARVIPPPPPPAPRANIPPRPATPMNPGAPPARAGRGPFFWAGAGCCGCLTLILLGVALFFGGLYWSTTGPVEAVRAQLKQIKSGDISGAYGRLSDEYRSELSQEQFALLVAAHPGLRDNADSTFLNRSFRNNTARIQGTLAAATGEKEEAAFSLVKEKGTWKISGIRFSGDISIPSDGSVEVPGAPAVSTLQIATLGVKKAPSADRKDIEVEIRIRVTGFATRPEGDRHRMDLVEDVETFSPAGQSIPSLSQKELVRFNDAHDQIPGYADFKATLPLAATQDAGSYRAHLTIHDRVTGAEKTHDVTFVFP